MTEAEWLTCTDPTPMLEFLRGKASDRKLRLLGCACCHRIANILNLYEGTPRLLEAVEHFADGGVKPEEVESVYWERHSGHMGLKWHSPGSPQVMADEAVRALWPNLRIDDLLTAARQAAGSEGVAQAFRTSSEKRSYRWWKREGKLSPEEFRDSHRNALVAEQSAQATLLREIFGNPFRPVSADPAWLTSDVVALARGIYDDRAFDRMPILADALQDAGCDNEDILSHCRDPQQVHVRGCWVVDLVLGKE